MYCSKCGKENTATAIFCNNCGNQLSSQTIVVRDSVGSFTQPGQEIKRTSVILMIFLSVITFGIYIPVWFLRRKEAINNLHSNEKLKSGIFVFMIMMCCTGILFEFLSGSLQELGEIDTAQTLDGISGGLCLWAGIFMLIKSFTVRRIFTSHYVDHLNGDISLSGIATFFFSIFYLQYKINRIKKP
jgi:hypothetical protein